MLTLKTKSILSAHVMKTRWLVVRKCVDDLMFHSEESNETFRLQNNTVYAVQSFQFKRTYLLCLHKTTHELQKTSFKQFKNPRNPKIWVHVQELLHSCYIHGHDRASNCSNPEPPTRRSKWNQLGHLR